MLARIDPIWVSAAKRAVRTFAVTYLGIIFAAWAGLGDMQVSGLVDAFADQSDFAAGSALFAAIGTLGIRGLLDPSPIPSLNDAPAEEPTPVK